MAASHFGSGRKPDRCFDALCLPQVPFLVSALNRKQRTQLKTEQRYGWRANFHTGQIQPVRIPQTLLPTYASHSKFLEDALDFEPLGWLRRELAGCLVTLLAVRIDEAQEPP